MTERVSITQQRASGGLAGLRSSASGRSLRAIGESAFASAEKRKAEPEVAKAGKAKRFVVGIDPGVKTGIAIWDRESGSLVMVETMDFWGVMLPLVCDIDNLSPGNVIRNTNTEFVVEIAHYAPTFRERRGKASNVGTMDRMARNVGGVTREAQLIVSGLRACGYIVTEQKPLGKAKKAADDRAQFERLTGWTKQTSQHARDAARLCFQA